MKWGIDWVGPTVEPTILEALAGVAAKSDLVPWLLLYWEPGEPWCPVERFVLANMIPRGYLQDEYDFYRMMGDDSLASETKFAELEGRNPRTGGHYCADGWCLCAKKQNRFVHRGLAPSITQRQWFFWREHGALAEPAWIVQGTKGGHQRHFSSAQKLALKTAGRADFDAPAPGDLAFAHPDLRMVEAIRAADRLRQYQEATAKDWRYRTTEDIARTRQARHAEFENSVADWLSGQLEEIAS